MAVDPPTDPAVCTRNNGLPTAPMGIGQRILGDQVATGCVGHSPTGRAVEDPVGNLADTDHASGHHRVGGQRTPRRVDDGVVAWVESGGGPTSQ
jgi:hypothetical protein